MALPAVAVPSAISWLPFPMPVTLAGVAAVTSGARVNVPVLTGTPAAPSTRRSEPTAKAAWSAADCRQLW